MGNKSSVDIKKLNFEKDDENNLKAYLGAYTEGEKINFKKFSSDLFPGLILNETNFIQFMNDYYKRKKQNKITSFEYKEIVYLAYLLTNANQNYDDDVKDYYGKTTFEIIYDIFTGKIGNYSNEINIENVLQLLSFIITVYINKSEDPNLTYSITNIENYLKGNSITDKNCKAFLENDLYNLEPFLKAYFKKLLFNTYTSSNIPVLVEASSFLTTDKFLFYILSNPHIYGKKYAFKLWDCTKNGFAISSLIYSFIGFGGPVTIFIQHFDKTENREYILGAYIHSNFKECYEKYCGDEFTKLFCLNPLRYYKFINNSDKICFISSKTQKFSNKQAGIGFGDSYGKYKLWIDQNDPFSKSYFNKYDDVFEEGSPLKGPEEFLNVKYFE
jgi:hypothetical protein